MLKDFIILEHICQEYILLIYKFHWLNFGLLSDCIFFSVRSLYITYYIYRLNREQTINIFWLIIGLLLYIISIICSQFEYSLAKSGYLFILLYMFWLISILSILSIAILINSKNNTLATIQSKQTAAIFFGSTFFNQNIMAI